MQMWAESGKSALPICNYSQILYQFLTFTQNLKRSQFSISVDFFTGSLNPIISSFCDTLLFNIIIHPTGESNLW